MYVGMYLYRNFLSEINYTCLRIWSVALKNYSGSWNNKLKDNNKGIYCKSPSATCCKECRPVSEQTAPVHKFWSYTKADQGQYLPILTALFCDSA